MSAMSPTFGQNVVIVCLCILVIAGMFLAVVAFIRDHNEPVNEVHLEVAEEIVCPNCNHLFYQ